MIPSMTVTCTRHSTANLGLELAYHVWLGPALGARGTVVFLHGFLDVGQSFDPVARVLAAAGWRVIAPDQRGYGESGHVGAGGYYHFPDYILDLYHLFEALSLPSATVIGHSMGASVACYFAGAWPERVNALALLDGIGPAGVPPERGPALLRRWVSDVRLTTEREDAPMPDLATVTRRLARTSPAATPERLAALATHAAVQGADGQWRWRFDPLHRTTGPIPFDAQRFATFLAAITCPVLSVWGERSPFRPPDLEARLALIKDLVRHEIAGAGHNLHHEHPTEISAVLLSFLGGNVP